MSKSLRVEVLVATMDQKDLTLYDKMNLRCDCLITNQCGAWGYQQETRSDGSTIRMISSDTRGVGLNRNLGLSNAAGDILLFADDDICYTDGTLRAVAEAFEARPDADVIAFGLTMLRNGEIEKHVTEPDKRRFLWNSMRFGTCRIAVRREAVLKHNLSFSRLFGGGCLYGSGEDTVFLRDCFRKGLKVYSSSYVLGTCVRDQSSWFRGYDDKFFFDRGAMLACAFPKSKHLVKWHFAGKLRKKTGISILKIVRKMDDGMKAFATITPYE